MGVSSHRVVLVSISRWGDYTTCTVPLAQIGKTKTEEKSEGKGATTVPIFFKAKKCEKIRNVRVQSKQF